MIKNDCIFCKLANGIFSATSVYEDEDFKAILDIAPAAKGHVLIIPKKHMQDIFDIDDQIAGRVIKLASRIAAAQKTALNCDGINILQNNGSAAWQSVFHLHVHLIPRYKEDGITVPWKTLSYDEGEADEYAGKIIEALKTDE